MLNYDKAVAYSSINCSNELKGSSAARFERIVASVAIVTFLSLATIVGTGELPFFSEAVKKKLINLGAPIGMKQAWRVFAPELRTVNWHTLCLIELADGTIKAKEFPRMEKLSQLERFRQEKKRSVLGERIAHAAYKDFKPSIARFYARSNDDSGNRPVRITFVFASAPMPPLETSDSKKPAWIYRDHLPEHINKQVYFSYAVQSQDLRK